MDENVVVSAKKLAEYFDCTAQYVGKHLREQGLPQTPDHHYDLKECVKWYVQYLKKAKTSKSKSDAKLKLDELKIKMAQIELAKIEGQVITIDDATYELTDIVQSVKSLLLAIPSKVAPQAVHLTTPSEIEDIVKKYIVQVLTELATIPERIQRAGEQIEETEKVTNEE